jgi:hypothetical protein
MGEPRRSWTRCASGLHRHRRERLQRLLRPLDGPRQRCWAQLPREIHGLGERHPTDAGFHAWSDQVHTSYDRARRETGNAAEWSIRHIVIQPKISSGARSSVGTTFTRLATLFGAWRARGLDSYPLAVAPPRHPPGFISRIQVRPRTSLDVWDPTTYPVQKAFSATPALVAVLQDRTATCTRV